VTTVTDEAYDDMAFSRIIVDAVEHGCTYEDRCVGVRAILKRHREAAEHRGRLEGAEIMREAANKALWDKRRHLAARDITAIQDLDPAAIIAQHDRTKAMDELIAGDADLYDGPTKG